MAKTKTAVREFKAHANHLRNTVLRQAGDLWKAILEAVMNSVDAGATRCDIAIEGSKVTISDDGRGFQTEDEIKHHFETFGTPHEEGDATYGEFRMGRGQLMAFGVNVWTTQQFIMSVDVKNVGMSYELKTTKAKYPGCKVEIQLYDKMSLTSNLEAKNEIRKYVKYVSIPVTYNGDVLSQDPNESDSWDHVTDEAYIKLRDTGDLRVYNLGVFVCTISANQAGCGGEVVSRSRLRLNFARNDVIRSGAERCPIWTKISPYLKKTITERNTRKAVLTDAGRAQLLMSAASGSLGRDFYDKRLFADVTGKYWSYKEISNVSYRPGLPCWTVAPHGNRRGDKLQQARMAFVFSQRVADQLECQPDQVMAEIASIYADNTGFRHTEREWPYREFSSLELANENYDLVAVKDLTKAEQLLLNVLERQPAMIYEGDKYEAYDQSRKIVIGDSEVADGWTDGSTYIAIARQFITRNGYTTLEAWIGIGHLLLHEYCHTDSDTGTHVHGPEFYELFHNNVAEVGLFVTRAFDGFKRNLDYQNKTVQKQLAKLADRVESVPAGVDSLRDSVRLVTAKKSKAARQRKVTPLRRPAAAARHSK